MPINTSLRAERIWLKIQRNPSSVIFTKPKVVRKDGTATPAVQLAAQTVRVNSDNRASEVRGVAGAAPQRQAIVYGVKGHPDPAILDTDMNEGYTFDLDGDLYRCIDVIPVLGGLQGTFTVNG